MPQAIFMNSKQRKEFWKDPTSVNGEVDFRLIEVIVQGCLITEVEERQPSILAAVVEPDQMKKFQDDKSKVKGYILGQGLSGATLRLKNEEPKGLSIELDGTPADDRINFIIKADKPVAPGAVLQIEVAKKQVSQVTSLAVGYKADTPTLNALSKDEESGAQGSKVTVKLTGTHFLPGPTQVLLSGSGVKVSFDEKSVTSTLMQATFEIDPNAELGAREVRVSAVGGPSKPVNFTVTKPETPGK